jgi:hypothetical protein
VFYVDLEYNSLRFYVSKNLIRIFGVTGQNRSMFLLPALSLVLHPVLNPVLGPALLPAQKQWAIWWLWYCRPVMGESGTWVLLVLSPSSY